MEQAIKIKTVPTGTVGRGRAFKNCFDKASLLDWTDENISLRWGDSLEYYQFWDTPTAIVSDGGDELSFRREIVRLDVN